jgi:4-amino-4-deoxy-L-arabinose transferase-like glycosyltransferase
VTAAGSAPTAPTRRFWALLGLLVLVALVIRVDALRNSALPVAELGDARAYELLSKHLAEGDGYVRPFEHATGQGTFPTAEYPPGLPAVLAVARVAGVDGATGLRLVLCGFGALTVGLVGLIGRRLGGDGAGYLAAAIAAVHPALWNTDVTLMAEPLAAFAGAGLVLGALAVADRPSWSRWLGFGLLAGLACFVRSEFVLIGPLLAAVVALGAVPGWGARLRYLGGTALVVLVVLAPWTVRNAARFGSFVPLTNNSGSVARGANCDAAYRGQFQGLWVTNVALEGTDGDPARAGCFEGFGITDGSPDEAEVSAQLRADGLAYARDHADELPAVVAARLGRTVGLYRFEQQTNFAAAEGRNVTWERRGTRSFQLLAVIGAVGVVVALARRRFEWRRALLLVPPAAVLVVVALTYGNPRFRAAAEPVIVVLAALAIADLAAGLSASRAPRAASAPPEVGSAPGPG